MGRVVMAVVEVHLRAEFLVAGACEEAHASVIGQDLVAQFRHRRDRYIDQHIVVAMAVRQVHQALPGILHLRGIDIDQLDPVLLRPGFGHHFAGAGDLCVIHIRHHDPFRIVFAHAGVGDRAKAHGAAAAHDDQVSAPFQAHLVLVHALLRVVLGVHRADRTAERFAQRRFVEAVPVKGHQCADLHGFVREDAVGCIPSEPAVGVARGIHAPLVVQGGLLGKTHPGFELVLPLLANLDDGARELMAYDYGIHVDILGGPLVLLALHRQLVGGHADAVAVDLCQDFVILDLRQFELFEAKVHFAVHSDCSCFHISSLR